MNKPQAVALLELIADLYRLANEPDPAVAVPGDGRAEPEPDAGPIPSNGQVVEKQPARD